jgi:hypothetical protein
MCADRISCGLRGAGYSPTSPGYSPTSPGYSPTSPGALTRHPRRFAFACALSLTLGACAWLAPGYRCVRTVRLLVFWWQARLTRAHCSPTSPAYSPTSPGAPPHCASCGRACPAKLTRMLPLLLAYSCEPARAWLLKPCVLLTCARARHAATAAFAGRPAQRTGALTLCVFFTCTMF